MLREVLASNAAKMMAACVCPVIGVGAIVMEVPQVRSAVHRVTAPKPHHASGRKKKAPKPEPTPQVQTAMLCTQPVSFQDGTLQPFNTAPISLPPPDMELPRVERVYLTGTCATGGGGGAMTAMAARFASVPEPSTWAQMIAGFAMLGFTLRARSGRRRMRA